MTRTVPAVCLALSLAALVPACSADAGDDATDDAAELSVPNAARLGGLVYGDTATTQTTSSPRYRAWSFSGSSGDDIEIHATSPDGDPVLWLTGASFGAIERADDVSPTDRSAVIRRKLSRTGTYWIVVAEAKRYPATINVTLAKHDATQGSGADAVDSGVTQAAGPRLGSCPNSNAMDCFRLAGTCYDHFACPLQGHSFVTKLNSATFHFTDGWLVSEPADPFDYGMASGDDLRESFKNGRALRVDGQEHPVGSTFHQNDVYATATASGGKVSVSIRVVAHPGSPYTAKTCNVPDYATAGGFCELTNVP